MMGNFLDTPITEKETEVGEDAAKGLKYGISAMQGWGPRWRMTTCSS